MLFLVFLGMVLTTGISYFHTKRTTEELAVGQMTQALGFLNRETDQRIRAIRFELGIWSKEGVFRLALLEGYLGKSARAAAGRRLADRLDVDFFDRALLADRNGDVVATSDPRLKGINVSQRGYFAEAMRGQSTVRGYGKGLATPTPVLVAAAPVFEQDGSVGGLLALVLDVAHFGAGILDTLRIGRTGGAFFLDADNTVLVAPSWKQEGQFSPDGKSVQALRASNGTRVVRYESGGVMRMAVAQPNQETGWLVVVEASEDDILTRARNVAMLNTLVAMCVLGLVAVAMAALRKAGASLEASEASYRILAETTPVGIATFDRQGRNTYANARAQGILGLAGDQAQRPFWEGTFETREGQSLPLDQLPQKQTLDDGQPRLGVVVWHQRQDGGRAVLSLSAAPLQAQGHLVHGAVLVLEDVTERMRIQEMMV
uniref:PAS domain S-box protein n=1 Tax=Fundidesulfovibrio putealis TaxID=270496 RepID=A0A7C3W7W3_9BACT